jgi:hypothetical protein
MHVFMNHKSSDDYYSMVETAQVPLLNLLGLNYYVNWSTIGLTWYYKLEIVTKTLQTNEDHQQIYAFITKI